MQRHTCIVDGLNDVHATLPVLRKISSRFSAVAILIFLYWVSHCSLFHIYILLAYLPIVFSWFISLKFPTEQYLLFIFRLFCTY